MFSVGDKVKLIKDIRNGSLTIHKGTKGFVVAIKKGNFEVSTSYKVRLLIGNSGKTVVVEIDRMAITKSGLF